MSPTTQISFLLARFAEEEERMHRLVAAYERDEVRPSKRLIRHSALAVPGDVLADLDTKRRIVEEAERAIDAADSIRETFCGDVSTRARVERASYLAAERAWRTVLDLLTAAYADRLDFPEEWRVKTRRVQHRAHQTVQERTRRTRP